MAFSPPEHVVAIPHPLSTRLDKMVRDGEFASFEEAVVMMVELGIAQHDGRVLPPAAGPAPPGPPRRDLPPPGAPGPGLRP